MRVLVACEFSGIVRAAFADLGHDAWSCDVLPSENNTKKHIQDDVRKHLGEGWDLMVGHPPCTYLNHAGVRWLYKRGRKENGPDPVRWQKMKEAAEFYNVLKRADIPRIALENSEMHPYARELCGSPDQEVQPWMFGHGETKCISLQLKNLPLLVPSNIVEGREARVHRASPGKDRWKNRSRTLPGVAAAMAAQWGNQTALDCDRSR